MPPLAAHDFQPGASSQAGAVTCFPEMAYNRGLGMDRAAASKHDAARFEPWAARPAARSGGPAPVSLDRLPDEVDGAWWTRHAHLLRDLDDTGRLFLEPGSARSWAQPYVIPERISSTSGDWARAFTRRVRRLRNVEKSLRACQGQDPHVVVTGPEGVDPADLARLVSDAARRPLGLGVGLRSADRTTASSLLAGLPDGGVLFLDRCSLGRGPGHDAPGDDADELSIALRAALIEGLANGSLTHEVSDGMTQRDVTLWLPWFVIVVVSSDEAQGLEAGVGPDLGSERPGRVRSTPFAPLGVFPRGFGAGVTGRESRHTAARRGASMAAGGGPGMTRRHVGLTGLPNVRRGAPNVRRTGPNMLWTP